MQLLSEKVFHFDRTYSPSSAGTCGNRGTLRLLPTSRALPMEKLKKKIPDQKCVLKRGDYSIRLADSPDLHSEASALIERMYSWRGYDTTNAEVFSHRSNWMTFEASSKQQLFGTLTLGIDGKEGLLADQLNEKEINTFRNRNRKVCELSKFAIDSQYGSKEVFASLFQVAYICARIHKSDDAFIEVNPRHTKFYTRMLGFRPIGVTRTCQRVGAPAMLMHLELDYMHTQISSLAGLRTCGERSLYPYFFSHDEKEKLAV